jgi:hypothetical protein
MGTDLVVFEEFYDRMNGIKTLTTEAQRTQRKDQSQKGEKANA